MQQAGIRMVRVGEFAWSRMEPAEGRYDLDWLDRAIALAAKYRIAVVLGTPTAAPPAWLTQTYPDTLRVDANGRRAEHGNRQHFSFTSPRYRSFCRAIAEQMGRRFGHNPNVLGWQIDNEYAEVSYDPYTQSQFQQWLKARYGSLDNLNTHWTTAYWSQTYFDWSQIPIPRPGENGNPGLRLDWMRFVSDTWRGYQDNQLQVLRATVDPRQFITTNFMGFFPGFDQHVVAQDLTFAAWDDYVGHGHLDAAMNGLTHDLTRGLLRQNFWVMETQPGAVNWAPVNTYLDKGEVRSMAWQAVGHGAETVSYWQWRSALNGQEQYHGTLVGADGTPVPLYDEVARIGREFAKASDALRDTAPVSEVALLYSWDSRWAIDFQKHNANYDQLKLLAGEYRELRRLAQSIDVVSPYAPLDGYKLVVAPDLDVLPADLAQHLVDWVRRGGHLVLGPRSGMKDRYNSLQPERQPGPLVAPLGGRVAQFYALDGEIPVSGAWGVGHASLWAEQMQSVAPSGAQSGPTALMQYGPSNGWLDGQPAVLTNRVGNGRITYIGTWFDDALARSATAWMVQTSGIAPAFGPLPEAVEACRRTGPRGDVFILLNHTRDPQPVTLPKPMHSILRDQETSGTITLPGYGVEVLTSTGQAAR